MRVVTLILVSCLSWVGRATAGPLSSELDVLLQKPECQKPVTVMMPKAPLKTLFAVLGRLSCGLRFELAPEVSGDQASIELKDAPLSTVLDLLAGNHNLEYAVEDRLVRVGRKGTVARPPVVSHELTGRLAGAAVSSTHDGRVRLRLAIGSTGKLVPAVQLRLGRTAANVECTMLQSMDLNGKPSLRLEADGTVKPIERGEAGIAVRLCAEKISDSGIDLVGESMLRQVFDDGRRTVEERTLFRRSVRPGDKDVSLYKSPQGDREVMLVGYEVEPPAGGQ